MNRGSLLSYKDELKIALQAGKVSEKQAPGLEPRVLDVESSALTMTQLCLPQQAARVAVFNQFVFLFGSLGPV